MLSELPTTVDYRDINATIMGLGSFGGGVAAAQFLAKHGANVTITDSRREGELKASLEQLDDVHIEAFFLGGHPCEAFDECHLLIVNPAVKPGNPHVERCRSNGVFICSEMELFLHHNSAQVVAVSGTNGKSTTAALIHHLLQSDVKALEGNAHLGGNIGQSLLPLVTELCDKDIVVLELSSFQLTSLNSSAFAPDVAVLTGFSPNHLDWHLTIEEYQAAKQVLFNRQARNQIAILPAHDNFRVNERNVEDDSFYWRVRGRCLRFGAQDTGENGSYLEDGLLVLRTSTAEDAARITAPRQLPGHHNANNIAAAACAAWALGADSNSFQNALATFQPLPHRLQLVAEGNGIRFYNDSVSTTPESSIAALQTFHSPMVILAGGSNKETDLKPLCDAIHERAHAAVLMGTTAQQLADQLSRLNDDQRLLVETAKDFREAFLAAVALTPLGGIVLLSPGCASYDWFRDFRDRGDQFTTMAIDWSQNEQHKHRDAPQS